MAESLRDRQRRVAREAILQAAADEVVERGVTNLSLQAVADRAGVSNRTLYNYFESRDVLLAELARWTDELTESLGGHLYPDDPALVPDYVRDNFHAWTGQGNLMKALVQLDVLDATEGAERVNAPQDRGRLDAIAADVRTLAPDLDDDQVRAVAQVLRVVVSSRTWYRLTVENDVPVELAGEAARWAYRALRTALSDRDLPFSDGDSSP